MSKARILIVDDDPDLTSALQVILESADYTVTIAGNRVSGMEKMRSERPDLLYETLFSRRKVTLFQGKYYWIRFNSIGIDL